MRELVKENAWAVTVGVSVLTACVSWLISLRIRKHRRLRWSYHYGRALRLSPDPGPRLEVLFDGKRVKELWLAKVSIKNAGTEEILKQHIHRPLIVTFGDARPLSVSFDSKGGDVLCSSDISEGTVVLELELLNPGTTIELAVLTDLEPKVRVVGIVSGVKSLEDNLTISARTVLFVGIPLAILVGITTGVFAESVSAGLVVGIMLCLQGAVVAVSVSGPSLEQLDHYARLMPPLP